MCLTQYIKLIKGSKFQLIVHKCWKLPNYHITTQQGAGGTILAVQYKTVIGENMARSIMKFWWPDEKWQIWLLARWTCKKKTLPITISMISQLFALQRFWWSINSHFMSQHIIFVSYPWTMEVNSWNYNFFGFSSIFRRILMETGHLLFLSNCSMCQTIVPY